MAVFGNSKTNNGGGFASDYFRQFLSGTTATVEETPMYQDPKDVATKFINRILIESNKIETTEYLTWCEENSIWHYHRDYIGFNSNPYGKYMRIFSFSKKEDAMAFKLRWT